jgi:arsenate reductase
MIPTVLFACIHNSGRSVAAKVLAEHYAAGSVRILSAGSAPGAAVNPVIAQVLAERGLSVAGETPKMLEDWTIDDPAGQGLVFVRRVVDDIDARVRGLLAEIVPAA